MHVSWMISLATSATQPLITCLGIVPLFHWLQITIAKFLLCKEANSLSFLEAKSFPEMKGSCPVSN